MDALQTALIAKAAGLKAANGGKTPPDIQEQFDRYLKFKNVVMPQNNAAEQERKQALKLALITLVRAIF
jgi:hypothetical protein